MSERPYRKLSIMDLENLTQNHWDDKGFLIQIRRELNHRKTTRAKKLLAKIRDYLSNEFKKLNQEMIFCEECGELMEVKYGKYGMFWGCTGYPHCKNSIKITKDAW
jgi:hypothetical protein